MERYKVAHFKEIGSDVIVVFVDDAIEYRPQSVQQEAYAHLANAAANAGLRGTTILAWKRGNSLRTIAPASCGSYVRSVDFGYFAQRVNRELTVA